MEKTILLPKIERFHLKLRLHNINGEYAEKDIEVEEPVYTIKDTKKKHAKKTGGETAENIAHEGNVHITTETDEILTRKVKTKAHAFPRNGINQPLVPLGTARGYLTGVLISVAKTIGTSQGQILYGAHSWIQNGGVKILPHWVALSAKDVSIVPFWVTEAKSRIYYEHVKDATAEIDVEVIPKGGFNAALVQELLRRGQGVGMSPKRRGYYEIDSIA